MPSHATVGINDNFPASQTGIALRSADDKAARWIDQEFRLPGKQVFRQRLFDYFFNAEFFDRVVFDLRTVLGGNDHICDFDGLVVHVAH